MQKVNKSHSNNTIVVWCINTPSHQLLGIVLSKFGFKHQVTFSGLKLSKIISDVILSLRPDNSEYSLSDAVANPVVAHIDGFGATELDSVVCDTDGGHVIGKEARRWLLVAEGF